MSKLYTVYLEEKQLDRFGNLARKDVTKIGHSYAVSDKKAICNVKFRKGIKKSNEYSTCDYYADTRTDYRFFAVEEKKEDVD